LVAVGTGPSSAQIGTSTDGGETFEITDLPLDLDPYSVFGRTPTVTASVAHRDGITVVATTVFSYVVPEEIGANVEDGGWVFYSPEGIEVCEPVSPPVSSTLAPADFATVETTVPVETTAVGYDQASCATSPWPPSFTAQQIDAAVGGTARFFVDDGTGLEEAAAPAIESGTITGLVAEDGAFVIAVTDEEGLFTSSSADGRLWTDLRPAVSGYVFAVERFGDGVAGFGDSTAQDPALFTSADASTWTVSSLTQLVSVPPSGDSWLTAQAVGPLGATAVLSVADDVEADVWTTTSYVLHTADGLTWSVTPIADLVGEEPAAISNVVMTADSVNITYREQGAADGDGVPQQRVLVGRYP
jgi:hypothetical protein